MKLAVIRHAATAWNLEKRVQGRVDQPLCARGREQLRVLALPAGYADWSWYCSPLQRAGESAELLGLDPVALEPALIEMDWGDWEGQVLKPLRRKLGDAMRDNEDRGLDFRPPGGESPREVQQRLQAWLDGIAGRGEDVGAIAHQGIVRCLYSMACGWDLRGESPVDFAWDAIHLFEFDAEGHLLHSYQSIPLEQHSTQ